MGFRKTLARPFDPALDWSLFDDAESFLSDSIGKAGAIAVAVVVRAAGPGAPGAAGPRRAAAERSADPAAPDHRAHPRGALRGLGHLRGTRRTAGAGHPGRRPERVAASPGPGAMVRAGLLDQDAFAAEAGRRVPRHPGRQLLTGLRGKDVSSPSSRATGGPRWRTRRSRRRSNAVLDADAASWPRPVSAPAAPSSPRRPSGGGSWLAHATLLSGLWIDNQQRYRNLTSSDRLTLSGAFQQAGWRTVGVMPGNTRAWPEGGLLRLRQDLRRPGHRLPRPDLQLGHHARPVHAVRLRTRRARQAGPRAAVRRDRPRVQPRAVGADPAAGRLERRRRRLGLRADGRRGRRGAGRLERPGPGPRTSTGSPSSTRWTA